VNYLFRVTHGPRSVAELPRVEQRTGRIINTCDDVGGTGALGPVIKNSLLLRSHLPVPAVILSPLYQGAQNEPQEVSRKLRILIVSDVRVDQDNVRCSCAFLLSACRVSTARRPRFFSLRENRVQAFPARPEHH